MEIKKILYVLMLTFFYVNCVFGQFTNPWGYKGRLNQHTKHIPENWHCSPTSPKAIKWTTSNRRYDFDVTFHSNCWYSSGGCGWNKAGRVTFVRQTNGNINKMMIGWQAIESEQDKIALSLFFHDGPDTELENDKSDSDNWVAHKLDTITTESKIAVDMFLGHDIVAIIMNEKALGLRKMGWIPDTKRSYLQRSFYFGGTCKAPQYMSTYFEDQKYDWSGYGDKFNSQEQMIWNITEFEIGDNFDFFASKSISASISDKNDVNWNSYNEDPGSQKCIIDNGSSISYFAGETIYLYPGFHAKNGSCFQAKIQNPPVVNVINFPTLIDGSITFNVENVQSIEYDLYTGNTTQDSSVYTGQLAIVSKVCSETIDTLLLESQYYLYADFYSGKGSKLKMEGWVNNNLYRSNSGLTGIQKDTENNLFATIYPNPISGIYSLTINKPDFYIVQIYSMSGNILFTKSQIIDSQILLDLTSYSDGIYFIKLTSGTFVQTFKLVKKS